MITTTACPMPNRAVALGISHEVLDEIERSIRLHGDAPLPNGSGAPIFAILRDQQREATNRLAAEGKCTHAAIFMEEVYEALAESDDELLRAELVQASAMAQKWIADIDRRHVRVNEED